MRHLSRLVSTVILVAAVAASAPMLAVGQKPAPPQPATPPAAPQPPRPPAAPQPSRARAPMVPLDVQVVISRSQGEKPISRLPYSLAVTANAPSESQLNMGADVPVPNTTFTPAAPPPAAGSQAGGSAPQPPRPVQSVSYRSVGTLISCRASGGEDGRYELTISVDDTSVFTSNDASPPVADAMPVFRNFKSRNTLLLRDGQTREYTAAADRVSGEIVRVEVTLRVVK